MIYNDRVKLHLKVKCDKQEVNILGEVKPCKPTVKEVPCMRSALTNQQQMGFFGKYNPDKFKLHVQGVYRSIVTVEYNGVTLKPVAIIHHKNSTVIVV